MRKIILLSMLLLATFSARAQFLYRLDLNKSTQKAPSYILASHKMGNPKDIAPQWAAIQKVLGEVKDAVWDFSPLPDSLRVVDKSFYLQNGKTLKDVLSADDYAKVNTLLRKYTGYDMTDARTYARYGRMTPHAMAENLDQLIYQKAHPDYNPHDSLNAYVLAMVQEAKLPVEGIWMSFKLAWRWNNESMEKQLGELHDVINDDKARLKFLEWSLDGYRKGLLDETTTETASMACGHKFCKRPGEWVFIYAEKQPTLFVLDAGELGGDWGVFKKLRELGATVTPVQ